MNRLSVELRFPRGATLRYRLLYRPVCWLLRLMQAQYRFRVRVDYAPGEEVAEWRDA
jgi:hypothetical protein